MGASMMWNVNMKLVFMCLAVMATTLVCSETSIGGTHEDMRSPEFVVVDSVPSLTEMATDTRVSVAAVPEVLKRDVDQWVTDMREEAKHHQAAKQEKVQHIQAKNAAAPKQPVVCTMVKSLAAGMSSGDDGGI